MPDYLVTGGAGFIGSHLVEALAAAGRSVRIVDNLSSGTRENIEAAVRAAGDRQDRVPAPEVIIGDLADGDVARRAVRDVGVVLHQAAVPSVPGSIDDPLGSNRANLDATLQLLLAARDNGVRRIVFAGSSAVYGDLPGLPKREDMPTAPLSPYGLQKLTSEQYLQLFSRLYGLETVTLRYFNVFGPRQAPTSPYSGVISLFIEAVLAGRQPTIYGDGEQTRDFTYVANVVSAVLAASTVDAVSGQVLNVATGTSVSLNHLLATLGRIAGRAVPAAYAPARAGDIRDSQADVGKAVRLLAYAPIVDFEEGLRRTMAWMAAASR